MKMPEQSPPSMRRGGVPALLWHFFRTYRTRSLLVVALLSAAGLAEGVSILALLPLVQIALAGENAGTGEAVGWVKRTLELLHLHPSVGTLLVLIVAGIVIKAAVTFLAMKNSGYAVAHLMTDLRHRLIAALMAARWSYFVSQPLGVFANAIGAETIRAGLTYQQSARLAAACIQIIVYGVATVIVSWQLAVFAMLTGCAGVFIFRQVVAAAQDAGSRQTELLRSLSVRITDTLQGIKAIKAMAAEGRALPLLDREIRGLDEAQRQRVLSEELFRAAQEPVLVVILAIGFFGAVTLGGASLPALMVVAVLFYRLFNRCQSAQEIYQAIAIDESAFWSVHQLSVEAERETERSQGAAAVPTGAPRIEINNVSYSYGTAAVLHGISLTVQPGEFVVISGVSGSGKTTLLDILSGLLQPTDGCVRIDGTDLREIDLRAWRNRIGYVPQEMLLLHDTILRNVTLSDDSITLFDAEQALRGAGIWDLVAQLPEGINTPVGERGGRFSGGQRQRISIARALVRRPTLLLLDEITAALDKESARAVSDTLRTLAGSMTIITISHQTEMARAADRVVRVGDGRIIIAPSHAGTA
jgi:ATP-binding cassette subfamily C protein